MKPIRTYHKNGQLLREEWLINGDPHRLDGPAIQYWYTDGQLRFESWRVEGQRHRLDGPACQGWHENGQLMYEGWRIDDKRVEPISDPLAWALWVAKNFGNVHGLEKFCSENIGEKQAKAIVASTRII